MANLAEKIVKDTLKPTSTWSKGADKALRNPITRGMMRFAVTIKESVHLYVQRMSGIISNVARMMFGKIIDQLQPVINSFTATIEFANMVLLRPLKSLIIGSLVKVWSGIVLGFKKIKKFFERDSKELVVAKKQLSAQEKLFIQTDNIRHISDKIERNTRNFSSMSRVAHMDYIKKKEKAEAKFSRVKKLWALIRGEKKPTFGDKAAETVGGVAAELGLGTGKIVSFFAKGIGKLFDGIGFLAGFIPVIGPFLGFVIKALPLLLAVMMFKGLWSMFLKTEVGMWVDDNLAQPFRNYWEDLKNDVYEKAVSVGKEIWGTVWDIWSRANEKIFEKDIDKKLTSTNVQIKNLEEQIKILAGSPEGNETEIATLNEKLKRKREEKEDLEDLSKATWDYDWSLNPAKWAALYPKRSAFKKKWGYVPEKNWFQKGGEVNTENLALVSSGEDLITKDRVKKDGGVQLYDAINFGKVKGYSKGGSLMAKYSGIPYSQDFDKKASGEYIDCSSLTSKVYSEAGVRWPYTTAQGQYDRAKKLGTLVSRSNLAAGDLAFFHSDRISKKVGRHITHIGVYLGKDPKTGKEMMFHSGQPVSGVVPFASRSSGFVAGGRGPNGIQDSMKVSAALGAPVDNLGVQGMMYASGGTGGTGGTGDLMSNAFAQAFGGLIPQIDLKKVFDVFGLESYRAVQNGEIDKQIANKINKVNTDKKPVVASTSQVIQQPKKHFLQDSALG